MIKPGYILFLFLTLVRCSPKQPAPACPEAGLFVMTIKNEPGRILPDSSGKFYLHFSPDGSMIYNTRAYPCNLAMDFQADLNVFFDGDFYENKKDSSAGYVVYIRDMDYR